MEVVRFSSFDELSAHADVWDHMAVGVPFRSWTWLSTWWRHYSATGQLYVLGVFNRGHLVGIAPWYRSTTFQHGRVLRCLGDGEVCSEYSAILCEPGLEELISGVLGEWLVRARGWDHWDVIQLDSTEQEDLVALSLAEHMAGQGCHLHSRAGQGCWRVALPSTWEDYLDRFSKDRRKKIRRMHRRYIEGGLAILHTVHSPEQLTRAQDILVDLHQRRRNTLGQPGCFASSRFRAFHEDVLPRLLQESRLGLHWVELEGRPIAAEYHLLGDETVYCYQGGIAPEAAGHSPGQIATLFALEQAVENGYRAFDFLRGNEPYKRQWRAEFRPNVELRIIAKRTAAQLRHGIWLAGCDVKHWVKEAMGGVNPH